jgi:predicted ATPase
MPQIQKIVLRNFKGIDHVEIDLTDHANGPVLTLIGLNESGKTTILEGISHFVSGDRSVSGLFDGPHAMASGAGLIPVHKKAAFTATVAVEGTVVLNAEDIDRLSDLAKSHGLELDSEALQSSFTVKKAFEFEDSVLKKTMSYWNFPLFTRARKKSTYKSYARPKEKDKDLWLHAVKNVEDYLPQISYFPTFLVDMPSRIYLREHDQEKAVNRHYRFVFQDILDSLNEGLSLDKHVCNRISDFKTSEQSANWFSAFFGGPTKAPVDSVFQKISNAITREVLGSWQRVFQRAISAKSIYVEWNIDAERGDMPYASFYVSDGESRYAISERSLGFRWFFSFLLFTAFKHTKLRKTIFIFDEPAANLHAKAQAELLTSFSKIASDGNRVIYSTHSHHMINPQWLSGAYIVENTALDYDLADTLSLSAKPTSIKAIPYRQFASRYPARSSYFQPVIEKLEYVSPEILGSPPYLLVEGISDFYALKLAARLLGFKLNFRLSPGVGAGASGPLVSQMLGRAESFAILLDDDKAGKREGKRYLDEWFLPKSAVKTLADVDASFSGKQLEDLLEPGTIAAIQRHNSTTTKPTKRQIGWYLAEQCALDNPATDSLCAATLANLEKLLRHYEEHFGASTYT